MRTMKSSSYIILAMSACFLFGAGAHFAEARTTGKPMKIKITFDENILTATMHDNPTTRDFISLLPLTVKLDDYAGTEKITYLQKKLSIENAPDGSDPSPGEICYYAPWGNLAIFYRDFGYAKGLIKLGKIDSNIHLLKKIENQSEVRIELMN